MRQIAIALFAGTLVFSVLSAAQTLPDLSGTWKMDPSRSESAHQDTPIGPVLLVIRQTAVDLTVETRRTQVKPYSVSKETIACSLNGTDVKNDGNGGVTITAKGHWDNSKLVVETEREINGSTVTTMQVFQLDPTGKELTIDKTLTVQHGYQGTQPERVTGTGKDVFVKSGK